jgi:hypothetical protein
VVPGPAVVGEFADLRNERQGFGAGKPPEYVAEKVVEEANVTAEQVVGGHVRGVPETRMGGEGIHGSI